MNFNLNNIINDLEKEGLHEFSNFFNENELNILKKFVNHKIDIYEKKNLWINDKDLLNDLSIKKELENKIKKIFDSLSEKLELKNYHKQNIYKVLRVISGKNVKKQSHLYHFDAHLFTILIPILVPNNKNEKNGDLVIYPNIRKANKNVILNIIQKFFFQNSLSRLILKNNNIKKKLNHKKIKLKPKSIYIFYGFRTLHGNLEFDNDNTRATLLMHFFDIFSDSYLIKINRKIRTLIENKKNNYKR